MGNNLNNQLLLPGGSGNINDINNKKKKFKFFNSKFDAVMTIGGGIFSYADSRKQGDSVLKSLGKVAAEEVFWSTPIGTAAFITQLAVGAGTLAYEMGKGNAQVSRNAYSGNFGGNYRQSQVGYTMRQRGLNAINNAGVNARNALGSEAKMFHRNHYYDR